MPKKEIVSYIKKELKKGFHISDIKAALYKAGHTAEDVEHGVERVYVHHAHMHTAIVLSVVIGVFFFVMLGFFINSAHVADVPAAPDVAEVFVVQEPAAEPEAVDESLFDEVTYDVLVQDDISQCSRLSNEGQIAKCRDAYYFYKAILNSDESFCSEIENADSRNKCFDEVQ